jgi:hypothetical protein
MRHVLFRFPFKSTCAYGPRLFIPRGELIMTHHSPFIAPTEMQFGQQYGAAVCIGFGS